MQCELCHMEGGHLADCPERKRTAPAPVGVERELADLSRMRRDDVYVDQMCRDTLATRGYATLNELAQNEPETLRELAEVAAAFLEEAPTEKDPGFVRGGGL